MSRPLRIVYKGAWYHVINRGAGRRTIFHSDTHRELFLALVGYNRMAWTDGPLFRGRFKAILVDADHYLAHLSRYIHLNPVMAKITATAHAYRWSSYPAYLRQAPAPACLYPVNHGGEPQNRKRQGHDRSWECSACKNA